MAAVVIAANAAAAEEYKSTYFGHGRSTFETPRGTYETRTYKSGKTRTHETTFTKKTYFPTGRNGYDPMGTQSQKPDVRKLLEERERLARKLVEDRQRFLQRLEVENERASRCQLVTTRDADGRLHEILSVENCRR